jgi:nitroreductase
LPSVQKGDSQFDAFTSQRDGYPRFGKVARQKLTEEETSQLLSLTALSLSAFNVNNCRFVVVRDPDLRKQINKFSVNQSQVPHAASLIILCAGLKHGEKTPGAEGDHDLDGPPVLARRKTARRVNDCKHRDEIMCSCGIAAQTLMLTAKAMNYNSWRLEGFDAEGVGKLINLPKDYVVAMLLVVGKNIKQLCHNAGQFNFHDVVVLDQF